MSDNQSDPWFTFTIDSNKDNNSSTEENKDNSTQENGPHLKLEKPVDQTWNTKNNYKHVPKKRFNCNFDGCSKVFVQKWILERHIISHFPFRHFKCEIEGCHKAYKSKENLILHHKNKHLGVKPYKCRFCDMRFSHRNGKTYHERREHINYLPYQCTVDTCKISFASKSALNYHLRNQHKHSD